MFLQNPRGLVLFPPFGLVWGEKRFLSCVLGSCSRHFPHRGEAGGVGQGVGAQPTPAMPQRPPRDTSGGSGKEGGATTMIWERPWAQGFTITTEEQRVGIMGG